MTSIQAMPSFYTSCFELIEKHREGKEPCWLHDIRQSAITRFEQTGFPTPRMEDWRQTNISSLLDDKFHVTASYLKYIDQKDFSPYGFDGMEKCQIVFINGYLSNQLTNKEDLPDAIEIKSIDSLLPEEYPQSLNSGLFEGKRLNTNPFSNLNTAFFRDGVFIHIPDGTIVNSPIHIVYLTLNLEEPVKIYPRTILLIGKNAQVSIVESYVGDSAIPYFTNAVTTIIAGENSTVDHYRIQQETDSAYHLSDTRIELAGNAAFSTHNIMFGGAITRNEITAALNAEGINCTMNGLYMPKGKQHVDNRTLILHEKPHCESHELYKGILRDESKGIFRGRILVQKDAQKTDAKQDSKTLLLSDNAEINAMPQLEIYADDVKCTHGATSGHLEDESIFYLQSRGIPKEAAKGLLTYAFASDVINRIKIETVRQKLDSLLQEYLSVHL